MAIISLKIEVDDKDVKGAEKSLGGLKTAARDTGTANKELGELEDSLNGVGAGSAAAAGGMGRLAAAAGPVGAALAVAAVAIAAVAAAAFKAGREIFELSKKYAELGEELARTSRETGVSAESISALRHQATLAGTEFSQVTSAIDAFAQKVVDASAGSNDARKTLEALGVTGVSAATDVDQAFSKALATLAEMPAGFERAKAANEAFGSSGSKLLPLLDEFDGDLQALIDSADEFGTLIGEDNVRDSLAFQRAIRENQQHVVGLKNEFINGFLPVITEVFEKFNSLLDENSEKLKSWVRTGAFAAQTSIAGIENQLDTFTTLVDLTNRLPGLTPGGAAEEIGKLWSRITERIERASSFRVSASAGLEGLPERGPSSERQGRKGREPKLSPLERVWNWRDLKKFAEERGFIVRSTTGGKHNVGSLHPQGLAIDIRTRDKTVQQIGEFIAQALAAGIRVVDERLRPPGQRVWKGQHLHLEENDTRASFFNRGLGFGGRTVEDLKALDEARRMGATQFIDDPRGRAELLRKQRIQQVRDILDRAQGAPTEISTQTGVSMGGITPRTTLNEVELDRITRLAPELLSRISAEEDRRVFDAGMFGERGELEAAEATFKRIKDLEAEFVESRVQSVELGVRRLHLSLSETHHQEIVNSMLEEARIFQQEELDTLNKQLEVHLALTSDELFRQYEAEAQVLREKLRLQQEIFGLETLIATQGANAAERYRKAWLEAIYEIRDENIRAVEDQIRAQVRLGDMQTVHNDQIRAKVLGHLAAQKSITETIGDEIIGLYEEIATRSEEILDRSIGKIPILGGLAKTLVRQSLSRATSSLLDTFFPGAAGKIEALQNPELGELKTHTSILKAIELNTAIGAGTGGAGNVTINASLGQLASQLFGGSSSSGTRPRIVGAGGNLKGLDIGQLIQTLSSIDRGTTTGAGPITTSVSSGTRPRIVNTGTFGPNGRFSAGNIGALASLAGGLIPGNVGGVISSIGSGIGIASSLGSILGISALGGPIGLAIGAGIGLLTAVFGGLFGSKKKKRDKQEALPQLMQGFTDAIQEFRDLITQVRTFSIDPDQALSRGKELRQQIASGFGIQFESKKYRRIARERINQQLTQIDAKPDGLMQQLMDAASIAKAAGDRRQRILPEFAGGVFMDAVFRAQFGAFKRRNGLLPGSWSGVDRVPALLADAEMVLNPAQQRNVIANAGGRDVFSGAGIPNYESKVRSAPAVHTMNTGGLVRSGQSETSPLVLQPNFQFEIQGVTFEEGARVWLRSDDGRRTLVKVLREEV